MITRYETKAIEPAKRKAKALDRDMIEDMQERADEKKKKQWRPAETRTAAKWTDAKG